VVSHALKPKNEIPRVLCGNIYVNSVENISISSSLSIKSEIIGGVEEQLLYSDVLYSQIDGNLGGERIAVVSELSAGEFCAVDNGVPAARFLRECGFESIDTLDEISKRGYRFFSHYIVNRGVRVVIAKRFKMIP
jgi:hypothetical protein